MHCYVDSKLSKNNVSLQLSCTTKLYITPWVRNIIDRQLERKLRSP